MRKLLIALFAVLFMVGTAHAISTVMDPTSQSDMRYTYVYLDETAATTADVGNVLCWDVDDSTGDNDAYVENCDSETGLVAGIVYPAAIAGGDTGSILIYGCTDVDVVETGDYATIAANALLCSSTTAGTAQACSSLDTEAYAFGFATGTAASGSVTACLK